MRKLASIQVVQELKPIPDADKIEVATILGWRVVCKKGDFSVGDKVIYCEIDSLFPDNAEFSFLKPLGMRIRTVRMRGQISQGICFPLSLVENYGLLPEDMIEGQDVASALGITKYEPTIPQELSGKAKGYIPTGIPKSDITRIQTLKERVNSFQGTKCYYTEKLDGESITFYIKDGVFGVCSKEVDFLETSESLHWRVARQLDIESKLRSMNMNFSLQGEIIGEGIKKNKYKIHGNMVYFYNAFDVDKYRFYNYDELTNSLSKLNLKQVPVISDNYTLSGDIDEILLLANGRSALHDTKREGIVICPLNEIADRGDRVIFKVISNEFLLKHGE